MIVNKQSPERGTTERQTRMNTKTATVADTEPKTNKHMKTQITKQNIGRSTKAFLKINKDGTVDADAIVKLYELKEPLSGVLADTNGGWQITDMDYDDVVFSLTPEKTFADESEVVFETCDWSIDLP